MSNSQLDDALQLLERLNQMTDIDGREVVAWSVVDGFEPWWFRQEQVYWRLLVPYTRHATLVRNLFAREPVDAHSIPAEVHSLLRYLGIHAPYPARSPKKRILPARIRRTLGVTGRFALAGLSLAAAVYFRLTRRDTLIYTIDNVTPGLDHDFRISTIYREVRNRGYRYGEYVHANNYVKAIRGLFRRRRPAVFVGVLGSLKSLPKARPPGFPPRGAVRLDTAEQAFLEAVARTMLGWCGESVGRYHALRRLLRLNGTRQAIILDDSRHANELIAACRSLGIPTLGYMHGLPNRYHPGLMGYGIRSARRHTFDLYGLWSEYFRARVTAGQLYDEENTFVCGPLRPPDRECHGRRPLSGRESLIRVLLAYEPRAPQQEILPYLQHLLEHAEIEIVIKTRPDESLPWLVRKVMTASDRVSLIRGGTVYDAFEEVDVVLGTYSTVLYEAALVLRPAVIMNTSFTYGHDLVDDGLCEFAKSPAGVLDAVRRASRLTMEERQRRRERIWGDKVPDGAAVLFDVAEAQLWSTP